MKESVFAKGQYTKCEQYIIGGATDLANVVRPPRSHISHNVELTYSYLAEMNVILETGFCHREGRVVLKEIGRAHV